MPVSETGIDRFAQWPMYSGLAIVVFCCLIFYWPITQLAFSVIAILWLPPLGVAVVALLVAATWCGVLALLRGQWRRMISMMLLPILLFGALPAGLITDATANKLTLLANRADYMQRINYAKQNGERLVLFDWGGNVMIGFNRFLVWDEEDQIDLPISKQTPEWKSNADKRIGRYRIHQILGDHFYLIEN